MTLLIEIALVGSLLLAWMVFGEWLTAYRLKKEIQQEVEAETQ